MPIISAKNNNDHLKLAVASILSCYKGVIANAVKMINDTVCIDDLLPLELTENYSIYEMHRNSGLLAL